MVGIMRGCINMARVWFPKCDEKDRDKRKITYWEAGNRTCPHKMSDKDKEKYQIHVRWFLKDGTELISRAKVPRWELKKPK